MQFTETNKRFAQQFEDGLHTAASLTVFANGKLAFDISRGHAVKNPLWHVFSMGKPLAAAVLWRFKSRGHFEWKTPVAEFWPEFGVRGKSRITVGHVLTHTAGLADHSKIPVDDYIDWGRVINHLEDMTPATEPGSYVHYHSRTFGWLVAEIASRISGLPFDECFNREVCYPLGLRQTAFTIEPSDLCRVVPLENGENWEQPEMVESSRLLTTFQVTLPAGSLMTTTMDAARFYAAISGKGTTNGVAWLPASIIEEVTSLQAEGNDSGSGNYSRVGFGIRLPSEPPNQYASNNKGAVGHGGLGTCTGWASIDDNVSVAFVANTFQPGDVNRNRLHAISEAIRIDLDLAHI